MNNHLDAIRVRVLTDMLLGDLREGYVIGQRVHAAELSDVTGVPAVDVLAMASEIAVITRMGAPL